MSSSSSSTLTLVRSAFGPGTTLYDALSSSKTASQANLKRAYRKLALRYHPDKQAASASLEDTTVKFQAVSAAYQVLMDAKRRSIYDATGRVVEDENDHYDEGDDGFDAFGAHKRQRDKHKGSTDEHKHRRWKDFFHSVFNDIMNADSKHGNADTYRKSKQEMEDVLKYYRTCKGDLQKVLMCVVHGSEEDVDRWRKEIIAPAIRRGDIEDYCGITNAENNRYDRADLLHPPTQNAGSTDLIDSDDEDNDNEDGFKLKRKNISKGRAKMKRLKASRDSSSTIRISNQQKQKESKNATALVDSDEDNGDNSKSCQTDKQSTAMSRRDKMEYRVAKKRKLQARKEIEMASIIKSKSWAGGDAMKTSVREWGKKNRSVGGLTNAVLSSMEKKYSKSKQGGGIQKTKIRRKKNY